MSAQALAAIDQYRSVAKWLITAFAAVGTLVLAGLQLTSLGETSGWRLFFALLGVGGAIGGAMFAVIRLSALLQPIMAAPDLAAKEADSAGTDLHEFLELHKTVVLPDGIASGQGLFDAYKAARSSQDPAQRARIRELRRALGDLVAWSAYLAAKRNFLIVRRRLIGASLLVAGGAVLYAWAATPPSDDTGAAAVPATPVLVTLHLNALGADNLATTLPAQCIAAARGDRGVAAIALAADGSQTTVVLVPDPATCPSPARLTIPLDHGVAASVASVTPAAPTPAASATPT